MADDIDKDYFNSLSLLLEKTEKGEEDLENLEAGIDFAIKYIIYQTRCVFWKCKQTASRIKGDFTKYKTEKGWIIKPAI